MKTFLRLELRAVRNSGSEGGTQKCSWPHESLHLSSSAWCSPGIGRRLLRAIQSDVPGLRNWLLIAITLHTSRDIGFLRPVMSTKVFFNSRKSIDSLISTADT